MNLYGDLDRLGVILVAEEIEGGLLLQASA